MNSKPIIGVTLGDPQGIGPEVVQKALSSKETQRICQPILFGDPLYFNWKQAKKLSSRDCGELSYFYISQAIQAAEQKKIHAMVTAPISKANLNKAGYRYPGHTELLAEKLGGGPPVMMMAGPRLKVSLVTIHEPLSMVSALLTSDKILETITTTNESLKKFFAIKKPRLAVAGLNPHSGESGLFGKEEQHKILPAIQKAQKQKINATGPFPPDTLFWRAVRGEYDAVIAMYHDQGLIPVKLLHFEEAVNVTLGLPLIRTSPDHGTAPDIAGQGIADPKSLIAAIRMATQMVKYAY